MTTEMVPYDAPAGLEGILAKAPALFLKEAKASERFFDFFTANIRNKHTRRAYYNAACKFSEFCAERGVHDLAHVKPPAINVIANRDFSEEPQKLSLNLHGDPCMALRG